MEAVAKAASTTKFCKDCEFVATSTTGWERYRCLSKENVIDTTLNLVTGETMIRRKVEFCGEARNKEEFCGQSAKWYKERTFKLEPAKEFFREQPRSKADEL